MKLTDWIPGNVKPVRVGVYKRLYDKDSIIATRTWYCYWNGEFWGVYGETPEDAAEDKHITSGAQNIPWRGLAEKP